MPLDTAPLDHAGMSYDAIQELKKLDISAPEVSEVAKAYTGGLSARTCIDAVQIFHGRHEAFNAGDALANLAQVGLSEEAMLELARLNQLDFGAGEYQAMKLAGLSEPVILEVARHRAEGKPVLAGASLARLRNAGVNDETLLMLARRGIPDNTASAILSYRRHGASDADLLREFPGSS